jgi:Kdo2-lipid IVA lauroyltransferase/acyltransferase
MAGIETMARAAPAQYLWIHRRFKRRPDGTSPYA